MAGDDADQLYKDKLRSVYAEGGSDKVVAFIQGTDDPELRRKLYALARQVLPDRKSKEPRFDDVIRIARAGIAEGLRLAELARRARGRGGGARVHRLRERGFPTTWPRT